MTNDQILFADLGLDALAYMKRVTSALDMEMAANVAAAFTSGAPFEMRVRMWANRQPVFSVVQVLEGNEIELHSTAPPTVSRPAPEASQPGGEGQSSDRQVL